MNLVSNFIGGISSSPIGASTASNIDLEDKTFSDLLEKQLNEKVGTPKNTISDSLGVPPGLEIQNLDGSYFSNFDLNQDNTDCVKTDTINDGCVNDITTSETVTFFNSLLDSKDNKNLHNEVFEFAKKQAANLYTKGASSVITDLNEFVGDILNT